MPKGIYKRPITKERFWLYVKKSFLKNGCWLWQASCFSEGYGKSWWGGKDIGAHVASWIIHFGPIPEGMFVLHHCDVRHCVNPNHLWLGTNQDNVNDMVQKRRCIRVKGSQHGQAKLTESIVRICRVLSCNGKKRGTVIPLAKKYSVSSDAIWLAVKGITWRHVT